MERSRRRAVTVLCAIWLALGFANVARGLPHVGPDYWRWAFANHSYSDLLTLQSPRYLGGGHPIPYFEDRIEYPPLLGVALWLPSFSPGGAAGHLLASALLLLGALGVAFAALRRMSGTSAWWLAATPALGYYAFLNWDLIPIAFIVLSLEAIEGSRAGRAGAWAALGMAAKLFPAALIPASVGALMSGTADSTAGTIPGTARGTARPHVRYLAVGTLVTLLVNLPLALFAHDGWSWFFRFNAARGAENSIWHALSGPSGRWLDLVALGPVALAGLLSLFLVRRVARFGADAGGDVRHRALALRLGAALTLVTWIALNKVWSPQYALYGFLAGALVAAPAWLFVALSAISVADYHPEFQVRALDWPPSFVEGWLKPSELLRTGLWLLLAGWTAHRLWRLASPVSGTSAGTTVTGTASAIPGTTGTRGIPQ